MTKRDALLIQAQLWRVLMKASTGWTALVYGLMLLPCLIQLITISWKKEK